MNNPTFQILFNELEESRHPGATIISATEQESKSRLDCPNLSLHHLLSLSLRSRDELLWTEFIQRSQPVIAGVVIKTLRRWARPTPSLVDDLVQETYLKLFANNARALRRFVCHH